MKQHLVRFVLFTTILLTATVQIAASDWTLGFNLYNAERYQEAALFFEGELETTSNKGPLYYNIGNCYFKQQKWGRAMFYYQNAKNHIGSDQELNQNIALLKQRLTDKIDSNQPIITKFRTKLSEVHPIALVIIILLFSFLSLGTLLSEIKGKKSTITFQAFIISSILSTLFIFTLGAKLYHTYTTKRGVIIAKQAQIKGGPDHSLSTLFVVHEGTVFQITKTVPNWSKISLENGLSGWINKPKFWEVQP